MRNTLTLVVAVGFTGCGSTEPIVCDGRQDVEFGTGDEVFIHLNDGDSLPIFDGPQGGSHLYGAVEACNIDGPIDVRFSVLDDTLEQYLSSAEHRFRPLRSTRTCCGAVVGMRGFVSIPSPTQTTTDGDTGYEYTYGYGGVAEDLDGHDLTLTISVFDTHGEQFDMTRKYVAKDAGSDGTASGR